MTTATTAAPARSLYRVNPSQTISRRARPRIVTCITHTESMKSYDLIMRYYGAILRIQSWDCSHAADVVARDLLAEKRLKASDMTALAGAVRKKNVPVIVSRDLAVKIIHRHLTSALQGT